LIDTAISAGGEGTMNRGIYILGSDLHLVRSSIRVTGNFNDFGILAGGEATLLVHDSSISVSGGSGTKDGIYLESSSAEVRNSQITATGGLNGSGFYAAGGGTHTHVVDRSSISSFWNSVFVNTDDNLFVGLSQLNGPTNDGGVPARLKCVNSYNGSFAVLTTLGCN
jgi:hypothetical protein